MGTLERLWHMYVRRHYAIWVANEFGGNWDSHWECECGKDWY